MSDESWAELEQKAPAFAKRLAAERALRDPAYAERLARAAELRRLAAEEQRARLAKEARERRLAAEAQERQRLIEHSTAEALSSLGIPPTSDVISRWEGLSEEEILDAIDRGFPDAEKYRRNGSIKADYSKIELLTPKEASLARAGISLKLAAQLATLESPVGQILNWLKKGFSGSELIEWEKAGIQAFTAIDWRTAGFTVAECTVWSDEGFTDPEIAREWLDSGLSPKIAARRNAAGLRPPTGQ